MASWKTPWMSFASCVMVLWMLSLKVCGDTLGTSSNSSPKLPEAPSCPDPEDIAPCKCTFSAELGMDMDCSEVASENELRGAFDNDFPFTDFRKFTLMHNHNVESLREGDLGSTVSFTEIFIEDTDLSEIETEALQGSFLTLDTLNVPDNALTSLPDISKFYRLKRLIAYYNQIDEFPSGESVTLSYIDIGYNLIEDVPENAIAAMPSLETLLVYGNLLTEIHPHTYSQNPKLETLNLGENNLTSIPDDAITLHGEETFLTLSSNQISSITHKAVSSVNYILDLADNSLTEVTESVFRPLLEEDIEFNILYNPFKCGCDMAWLVLNRTLIQKMVFEYETECADLTPFENLDPEKFKVMCPNATAAPSVNLQ